MSPNETLFLESTNKICREDVSSSSFVSFQIWDFPGQIDFFDPTFDYEMIFRGTGALIFVIDSQVQCEQQMVRSAGSETVYGFYENRRHSQISYSDLQKGKA
ncbi:ras-related GTP-binding protein D-like isoform X2 [Pseudoliparis swirei]|uniref:ras-related GTP-binding protein D-like isoform X2 n=1 Tax=Pseudoliparis swirei TaxID=2059687 RepID=UPI0024BF06F4|nr:ras-related GTP-binding protein D-like isoform X2 [Pseudoliparis swirei]